MTYPPMWDVVCQKCPEGKRACEFTFDEKGKPNFSLYSAAMSLTDTKGLE